MALNPKLFQVRLDYAAMLLQYGKKDEALHALDEGMKYEYHSKPA